MNLFSVHEKIIIITGGCGFLGTHFKNHLVQEGGFVEVMDTEAEPSVDITDEQSISDAVDRILDKHGRIDGLVHAAAIDSVPSVGDKISPQFSPYETYPKKLWEKAFSVNLQGAQLVTQKVAPHLMRQGFGSVVFISSDLGLIAPNNTIYDTGSFKDIAYSTSKAAVIGLSRNWASYLGTYGVRSNAISPGGVYNGQPKEFVRKNVALNMMGRMARPEEYNGAVQFLLSDASSYMTGANMVIDGGRTAW